MKSVLPVLAATVLMLAAVRAQNPPPQAPPAQNPPAQKPPAQTPPAQPQEQPQRPPTFRTGTNLVRVDVTVIDRSGKPVIDLTTEDFEVTEDGKPQPITSFKLVEATGQPTDDFELPIRGPDHAAAEAAKDDVRLFLLFWDEYHINEFVSTLRAKEQLTKFVLDAFGPTDLVGLMDPLTPMDAVRFSRDRRWLADQIHKVRGRRGVYVPARSVLEESHMYQMRDIEYIRAQVTASALKAAIAQLGAMKEGRKSIIFISETLGPLRDRTTDVMRDLIQTANDANTAIFTVDPRGLQMRRGSDVLDSIASATGGNFIISNDMDGAMRKIVLQASAFYLVGYSPDEMPMDGKFHDIKVRVKRRGLDVSSRSGYWAPRAADVERERTAVAAAEAIPNDVTRAFAELTPATSPRGADYWLGIAPGAEGRCAITVAWTPRPTKDPGQAIASVHVAATGDEGSLHDGPVEPGGSTFEAGPGTVAVTFTARNAGGEVIDREQRDAAIPNTSKTTLALGTPTVLRARNAVELRELSTSETPAVFAGREFTRGERIIVRVDAFGASANDAVVTARLLGQKGLPLAPLPVKAAGVARRYQVELPIGSVAKGDFLVEIAAKHGDERVHRLVPIRVK